jgi:hypothetical protein
MHVEILLLCMFHSSSICNGGDPSPSSQVVRTSSHLEELVRERAVHCQVRERGKRERKEREKGGICDEEKG